ncbi:MAG: Fic family protein [Bryobacteraceae bacterium]|jgi:Fic family protein
MRREYEDTHPWLRFSVSDLRRSDPSLWAMLGECQSKFEHIAGVPLTPNIAGRFHRLYLAKGALATTAIEGNTLSEEDVLKSMDGTLRLPPSREYLEQEVKNIIEAFETIFSQVLAGLLPKLNAETFMSLNRAVLRNLSLDEGVSPGEIRKRSVGVVRYRGAPHADCRYLLDRLGEWLDGPEFAYPDPNLRVAFGVIKAILAHLYLAWIHPFGDGNGRTARLVEFQILVSYGVASPALHLLSNHYNLTRSEYYRQLDRASKSGGDVMPFIKYAVQGLLDGLREQVAEIRRYQLEIMWSNHVHEVFGNTKSAALIRRRNLVLDISKHSGPIRFSQLREISPRTMEAYRNKTMMTLKRDIRAIQEAGLIVRSRRGILPNKSIIEAFLPDRLDFAEIRASIG